MGSWRSASLNKQRGTGRHPTRPPAASSRYAGSNQALAALLSGRSPVSSAIRSSVLGRSGTALERAADGGSAPSLSPGQPRAVRPRREPDQTVESLFGPGRPLTASERAPLEARLDVDLGAARVHSGEAATAAARHLGARAFTVGRHMVFPRGGVVAGTSAGAALLAHEATHVAQQAVAPAGTVPAVQRQEVAGFTPEELGASEEEVGEAGAIGELADTGEEALKATTGASRGLRAPGRISRVQFLRKVPDPAKGDNVSATLAFNTVVYVEGVGGAKDGWYRITTATGEQGWVPNAAVALDPPELTAELYRVQKGDTPIDLAGRWYKPPGGFEKWWLGGKGDARFYVAALAYANKGRAGMPSPTEEELKERDAWMKVELKAGFNIWKPSKAFLDQLRGIVSSGSITGELWEKAKKAAKWLVGWIIYGVAFVAGLLAGALESLWDLVMGLVDLVEMIWKILKSLFTGNIVSDAKALWEDIKGIDPKAIGEYFRSKWEAEDPWDRGFFRGRVVGYIIMEIVMLVFSGGILTAIKWTGKFAKVGSLIAKLPRLAKLVEAAKALKIPEKAAKFLKTRFAAKLGPKGIKILEGVEKGRKAAASFITSAEHLQARAAAWQKYVARGGKKSRKGWEAAYDTLTKNRMVGKVAEEQFKLVMGGAPKTYKVTVGGKEAVRYVDNLLGNVAREVKSGPVHLTPFIRRQIVKDVKLIQTMGLKVEWHLLAGADPSVITALQRAGITVIVY